MPKISVPLAVWGDGYADFFDQWYEGLENLGVQPDEIVLVTDEKNVDILEGKTVRYTVYQHYMKAADYRLWDYAVRKCHGDWIAFCNIDDQFLPNALDQIEEADAAGCNLLVDSLIVKQTGHRWTGHWDPNTIPQRFTMPGAEPMRKDLYIAAGGFDYRFQYPDWALAVNMVAKSLAKPFAAKTDRIIFDNGADRVTLSGGQQNPSVKAAGTAQVHELSKSLGLL